MGWFRKKPVEIEAIVWDGSNWREIHEWGCMSAQTQDDELWIPAQGTILKASVGDYIIKVAEVTFTICNPDIFEMTYEPIERE